MNRVFAIFNALWRWWPFVFGGLVVLIAWLIFSVVTTEARTNHEFVQAKVLPIAQYVQTFRDTAGRLPTTDEFMQWSLKTMPGEHVEYYTRRPEFVPDWGVPGRDFLVGRWRGQWPVYYRSWDGKDFAGEALAVTPRPK